MSEMSSTLDNASTVASAMKRLAAIAIVVSAVTWAATVARAEVGVTARDAGARYGQALGALEICPGSKLTDKAKGLEATMPEADREAFKDQATKIFDAWLKVKACSNQGDPNQCKLIMDASCAAALAEIGPKGSALPGLLDYAN